MCRALKILCAARGPARLAELKRATVSAHWELVGGAASAEEVLDQVGAHSPDVLVMDAGLGSDVVRRVREAGPNARVVVVGEPEGEGAVAVSMDAVREAILGSMPGPGGPVRR